MTHKTQILAASFAAVLALFAASSAEAAIRHMVQVYKTMQVTTQDGRKLDLEVVKMNGHMMVLVPEDAMPDFFHQQLFKRAR